MQMVGCAEGAGQDYARLNATEGIIELHPTFNTTSVILPVNQAAQVALELAPGSVGSGWETTYNNLTIVSVSNFGSLPVFGVVVCSGGGVSMGITFLQSAIPNGWVVGAKLNSGVKRV